MKDIETKRLNLKRPTIDEKYDLFNILRKAKIEDADQIVSINACCLNLMHKKKVGR